MALRASTTAGSSYEIDLNSNGLGVGHSLLDQSIYMLDYFQDDVGSGTGNTQRHSIAGSPLQFNWDNAGTAIEVNGRTVLAGGAQDFLILTESVPFRHVQSYPYTSGTDTFDSPETAQSSREICDPRAWVDWHNLAAANGVTRVFVYETWHDTRSGTASQGDIEDQADPFVGDTWRDRIDNQRSHWEEFVTLLRTGDHPALDFTASITAGTQISIIPGGQVLAEIHDILEAGTEPGNVSYTDFFTDFFSDDIHPTIAGRYAIACAMYACVFRTTPVGLPGATDDIHGTPFATVSANDAAWLQSVAWSVCQADSLSGL